MFRQWSVFGFIFISSITAARAEGKTEPAPEEPAQLTQNRVVDPLVSIFENLAIIKANVKAVVDPKWTLPLTANGWPVPGEQLAVRRTLHGQLLNVRRAINELADAGSSSAPNSTEVTKLQRASDEHARLLLKVLGNAESTNRWVQLLGKGLMPLPEIGPVVALSKPARGIASGKPRRSPARPPVQLQSMHMR